jgi:hypothetical protein
MMEHGDGAYMTAMKHVVKEHVQNVIQMQCVMMMYLIALMEIVLSALIVIYVRQEKVV